MGAVVGPFLVTGCGRSGSTFTARLLTNVGIRTSHEEFFTSYTPPSTVFAVEQWLVETKTAGEVSGLAAPWLRLLPVNLTVIHLVRNPVAVIASLMGLRNLHLEMRYHANIKFNFRYLPQLKHEDDPLILCMKYWLYWNRLVEPCAQYRWQVERLQHPLYLRDRLAELGHVWSLEGCEAAIQQSTVADNAGKRDMAVRWNNTPDSWLKRAIRTAAHNYGYSDADLEDWRPFGISCPCCGANP